MVISSMKQIFSEHGIPTRLVSDNRPQYSCEAFKEFAQQWQVYHIISSPRFSRSNGFVERQIQTVKRTLLKAKQAGREYNLAMLCLRATPISHNLPSPAKLLNQRVLKTNVISKIPIPKFPSTDHIREELKNRQDKQKTYYNKTAKHLPPLVPGQTIHTLGHQTRKWKPGKVLNKCTEPRSYIIQFPDGSVKRQNKSPNKGNNNH